MSDLPLKNKCVLITGAAWRVGKIFALACATAGADVVIHHGHSEAEAEKVRKEITGLGRQAWIFKVDLNDSSQTFELIGQISASTPLHGLLNSAAIFGSLSVEQTRVKDWEMHILQERSST